MKILYDHQIFASQAYGGVSRYFSEVIRHISAAEWEVTATLSNNQYARQYGILRCREFLPRFDFRHKGRLMSELGKPYSAYRLRHGKYDLFHSTNFDPYCIAPLGLKPMVVTYHDTNFITSHNYNRRMQRGQELSLARADHVIAVSEHTRRDMLEHFNLDPDMISVIHHGVSRLKDEEFAHIKPLGFPYILYVGLRHGFKNFRAFARAFSLVAHQYPEVDVVCTRQKFSREELSFFRKLTIENRMHAVVADETALARLYADALFFIFPSRYEGFGMPILEAMSYGCPCALAKASCFPEIAGDAALYFSADDIGNMADIIERLLNSASLRTRFAHLGLQRVAQFSWERCAQQHMDIYSSLI